MRTSSINEELFQAAVEVRELVKEIKRSLDINIEEEQLFDFLRDFFNDYNSSYSLSLAYPESLWKITAENMGLAVEGKDRLQLAKEVFSNIPHGPSEEEKPVDQATPEQTDATEERKTDGEG